MTSVIRLIVVALALLLGLAFHSRNHQLVRLDFYTATFELPLSWVAVGALVVGASLGILVLLPRLFGLRRALARETKRAGALATLSPPHPSPTTQSTPSDGR